MAPQPLRWLPLDGRKKRRKQTLFRLWSNDRKKLLKKLIDENLTLQTVLETVCLGYLRNDPLIMQFLSEHDVIGVNRPKPRFFEESQEEKNVALLAQLEAASPLKDKEIKR